VTFIVVTHDQDEAMTLATRIGVMKDEGDPPGRRAARDLRGPEFALMSPISSAR
jgi:ABC-type proline/glycine betaine transport system ATPase subunit